MNTKPKGLRQESASVYICTSVDLDSCKSTPLPPPANLGAASTKQRKTKVRCGECGSLSGRWNGMLTTPPAPQSYVRAWGGADVHLKAFKESLWDCLLLLCSSAAAAVSWRRTWCCEFQSSSLIQLSSSLMGVCVNVYFKLSLVEDLKKN